MKKLRRRKTGVLLLCLTVSVLTVAGVPMIPLGFASGVIWVAVLGIVFIAHGMYGLAFYWIWYAGLRRCSAVVKYVHDCGPMTAAYISSQLGYTEQEVKKQLHRAIENFWLKGYRLTATGLEYDYGGLKKYGPVCEYCGGREFDFGKCVSCGAQLNLHNKK